MSSSSSSFSSAADAYTTAAEKKAPSYFGIDDTILFTVIFCLLFFIFCLAFMYFHGRRILLQRLAAAGILTVNVEAAAAPPVRTKTGLDASSIAAQPAFKYSGREEEDEEYCAVCLSVMEKAEMVRMLFPCRHLFHAGCIDMWLRSNSTCPVCRADAAPPAEE